MKRVATGLAAAIAVLGMNGAHAAQATAVASQVTVQVVNIDPTDTNPPQYDYIVPLTDVDAMVDGQPEFNSPEVFGFMASASDASPPSPDASSSARISGGNTMFVTASSIAPGSAIADADTGGGGELELGAGERVTFSMTLQLDSSAAPGEGADAFALVCFVDSCDRYDANDTSRTITYSRSFSNTTDDFTAFLLSLGIEASVTSATSVTNVPEPPAGVLLALGLGVLSLPAWRPRRRGRVSA